MARVIVVGGGLGGMAAAARLAKLGHEVTLFEAGHRVGGALGTVEQDGFTWDAGPSSTLLPAVVRDLFRKTGRPLERELELVPCTPIREHRFRDGSRVALPGGSRAAQLVAFDTLGPGLGQAWVDHVAAYAEPWELVRRHYLERPYDPDLADPDATAILRDRTTLQQRLARALPDERLRAVALHHVLAQGHDPRRAPAWVGLTAYLEQRFGAWTVAGGFAALGAALAARLVTRGVTVHTDTPVADLLVRSGRVQGVATAAGAHPAEVVVTAVDPQRLPALARHTRRTTPTQPPTVTHVGVQGDLAELAHETVLHGTPDLLVHRGGSAPTGHAVLTVVARGVHGDPLTALAARGLDLRDRVVACVERSPADLLGRSGGSPYGVRWAGRATVRRRLGPGTPIAGLYAAGAHATPGSDVPFVGLSAALVAQLVGPA